MTVGKRLGGLGGGQLRRLAFLCGVIPLLGAVPEDSAPIVIPFDFAKSAIEIDVTVRGVPLHMILDTGVDPSVIDLAVTDQLDLAVDKGDKGEASGFGGGKGAAIFPAKVDGIAIAGRAFAPFDALATDMSAFSTALGRKLDGVLGYSFLADKIVLIDYPEHRLALLDRAEDSAALTRGCRTQWTVPLETVDSTPVISNFRFGSVQVPVTLDTGSTGYAGLFQSTLALPGVQGAMREAGTIVRTGARGEAKSVSYRFDAPVGFGPFTLPAGVSVSTYGEEGSVDTRAANIGNKLLAAMKLKVRLDYRARRMVFFGDCD